MKRQPGFVFTSALAMAAVCLSTPPSLGQTDNSQEVTQAYKAYVEAWKSRDFAALRKLISDDYMAVNFEGKLSDKQNELATAKADAEWLSSLQTTGIAFTTFSSVSISSQRR